MTGQSGGKINFYKGEDTFYFGEQLFCCLYDYCRKLPFDFMHWIENISQLV